MQEVPLKPDLKPNDAETFNQVAETIGPSKIMPNGRIPGRLPNYV